MTYRACEPLLGSDLSNFMAHIDIQAGCWNWTGRCVAGGYGRARHDLPAHRVAFVSFVGPIPDGMMVCHHCDNPPCCNPAHLFLGTAQDNMADAVHKGRFPWRRTAVVEGPRAKYLTPIRVTRIRELLAEGYTQRQVARMAGVDHSTVSRLSHRAHWTDEEVSA